MNENDKFHVQISFCFCTIERDDKKRRNKFCSLMLQSTKTQNAQWTLNKVEITFNGTFTG